jgi:tetratricopeptide (TPR) repeat protein
MATGSDRRTDLGILLALVAATLGVYGRAASFGFLNYDDPDYVTENPHVRAGLSWASVVWALTSVHHATWHPLTSLSHLLDATLFGVAAGPAHLVNVVLHAASTAVLFWVLRGTTGARGPSALVAALFALHPLHVESVAWISERKDVLSTLFWMLTLWAWAAWVERPTPGRYLAALLAFALGLLAKPMLVTLPFVLLLFDWWPLRRTALLGQEALRARRRAPGALLLEKLPFLVLAAAVSVITYRAQAGAGAVSTLEAAPLDLRLANAVVSYATYLVKALVPAGLAVFYPYPRAVSAGRLVAASMLLLALTLGVVRARRRHPWAVVGWAWYVGTLVPVIGLVKQGDQAMADRFTYVPLVGIFILVAWTASVLVPRRARLPLAAAAVLTSAAVTWVQLGHWRDDVTLFTHAVAVAPESTVALTNLGAALLARGDAAGAAALFERALTVGPDNPQALVSLGKVLADRGEVDAALARYRRALDVDPRYARGHFNLGLLLADLGQLDEAATHLETALRLDPDYAKAHVRLGLVRATQGDLPAAIAHYEAALRLRPDLAAAHGNLAVALEETGRLDEAIAHHRAALRLEPDNAAGQAALASALAARGDGAGAVAALRSALRSRPEWLPAEVRLAWLLATLPDPAERHGAEAVTLAERANAVTGGRDAMALRALAAAYAEVGRLDEAVAAAERARAQAQATGQVPLASAVAADLDEYRGGRPLRRAAGDVPR